MLPAIVVSTRWFCPRMVVARALARPRRPCSLEQPAAAALRFRVEHHNPTKQRNAPIDLDASVHGHSAPVPLEDKTFNMTGAHSPLPAPCSHRGGITRICVLLCSLLALLPCSLLLLF